MIFILSLLIIKGEWGDGNWKLPLAAPPAPIPGLLPPPVEQQEPEPDEPNPPVTPLRKNKSRNLCLDVLSVKIKDSA